MKITLRRVPSTNTTILSSPAIDWDVNINFSLAISANTTFTFSNAEDGQTMVIKVINSSASALTLAWPVEAVGASTSISANKTKVFTFIKLGSVIYSSSMEF